VSCSPLRKRHTRQHRRTSSGNESRSGARSFPFYERFCRAKLEVTACDVQIRCAGRDPVRLDEEVRRFHTGKTVMVAAQADQSVSGIGATGRFKLTNLRAWLCRALPYALFQIERNMRENCVLT